MSIDAVAAVAANHLAPTAVTATSFASESAAAPGAFDTLVAQLQHLNTRMEANQQAAQTLAVGDAEGLHRVLMEMDRTRLLFDLTLQVRNKVLDAYQELMRMQV